MKYKAKIYENIYIKNLIYSSYLNDSLQVDVKILNNFEFKTKIYIYTYSYSFVLGNNILMKYDEAEIYQQYILYIHDPLAEF